MTLGRREFITLLGGTAAVCPTVLHAQKALPVIAFINGATAATGEKWVAAFRKGLGEAGIVEGQSATVEYYWLDGAYDRIAGLIDELVRRRVAVIATPSAVQAALAAKQATSSIPIVFGVAQDPTRLGLVESLAQPGGNATGINFFQAELQAKRLRLLHDLLPKAVDVAVLVNPANKQTADATLSQVQDAAPSMGLRISAILKASTAADIDAAFDTLARVRPDALFMASDTFFTGRAMQFSILAAHQALATSSGSRLMVEAGSLMSYSTDAVDMFRQVGVYAGRILSGAKPADLPVLQSTKFEFTINLVAARMLGIEVPSSVLAAADVVIE
jgi:putative tryptophan/tyrosine transport system substrate-binding protein